MTRFRAALARFAGVFLTRRRDAQLDEEIQAHLNLLVEEHMRRGLSNEAARAAARRDFGGVEQIKESHRDLRVLPFLDDLARDVRIAFRSSLRNRAFTATVIATLTLGIGATVAMLTVLDQVVLRPLSYPNPDRLVRLESPVPGIRPDAVFNLSTAEYFYFRRETQTLEDIGIYTSTIGTLGAAAPDSAPERVVAASISREVFELLGARPVLGRFFTEEESHYSYRLRPASVVILSHDLWQNRFGGSADVIGRSIVFNDRPLPIVGVLGPDLELPETAILPAARVGIWMPLGLDPNLPAVNEHTFRAIGRLRPGATLAGVRAELETLTTRLPDLFPNAYSPEFMASSRFTTAVIPLRDDILGSARLMIWLLAGAIVLVFVIAAANVANLFLARAESRRRELNIRLAVGATRRHLLRHTLAESLLLSLIAALAGVALAAAALRLLVTAAPAAIPRLGDVRIDSVSIVSALVAALVAAVSFAVFASLRSERNDQLDLRQLKPTASPRQRRLRSSLVVAQVAVAVVLAAGAALMARSVWRLLQVDPGFDATDVLTFDLVLPQGKYTTEQLVADYHRTLAAALEADPAIDRVSAATTIPLDGNDGCSAVVVEDQSPGGARRGACAGTPRVTPGYFEALGIPIRGRAPEWTDAEAGVVVNESLARRLWPGEDPLGKGIRANGNGPPYYRVVGVAADVRTQGFDRPAAESVYFPVVPLAGAPLVGGRPRTMSVVIRSESIGSLLPRARSILTALDANVPIANVRTMDELVARSMSRRAFTMALLTMAALLAILLSAVGLYGVISYGVASRRSEIGVRLALGARAGTVRMMVVRETLGLVLAGLAIGIVTALASTRLLVGFLFGVGPRDPATLGGIALLLLVVGLAAAAIPAWRASRVDPMAALRCE